MATSLPGRKRGREPVDCGPCPFEVTIFADELDGYCYRIPSRAISVAAPAMGLRMARDHALRRLDL